MNVFDVFFKGFGWFEEWFDVVGVCCLIEVVEFDWYVGCFGDVVEICFLVFGVRVCCFGRYDEYYFVLIVKDFCYMCDEVVFVVVIDGDVVYGFYEEFKGKVKECVFVELVEWYV